MIGASTGTPRIQSDREATLVFDILREFSEDMNWRSTFGAQWEEAAQLVSPDYRNTFYPGSFNTPGQKKTDRQIDASGMLAAQRFGSICNSLLTPENSIWHNLGALDPALKRDRDTQVWFLQARDILFQHRYAPHANFIAQNQSNFHLLGVFGNMCMFIDQFDGQGDLRGVRGLRYKAIPVGELYLRENHQGLVNHVKRYFTMTAAQVMQRWPDRFPEIMRPALDNGSQVPFYIIHRVCPREEYDPERLDDKGKAYRSEYISLDGRSVLQEGGYHSFPYAIGRYAQAPGEVYGRGPAQMVLPALKTLNAQKKTFLKAGHRAADPVLLVYDDGLIDFDMKPGAFNKGGMSSDGKPLVGTLPVGNIQVSEKMMEEEKSLINDAFLVSLFQILLETPQMTATEVIERTNEKGILLAPTVGRQSSEYLGPMIHRELDLLASLGMLPPMPPALKRAAGAYGVTYTNPMAKAMRAQEASGFIRTVESVKELVAITQDSSLLDPFDFETAIPEIADIQGVPITWMADDEKIAKKRKDRADAQKRQEAIQAAPAQAAMMKAQAATQQAGVPQPQTPALPGPGGGG